LSCPGRTPPFALRMSTGFFGYLNFMSHYNKTQTNQEKERVISWSIPSEVAWLMIAYLMFVPKVLTTFVIFPNCS
jgi:hypothetical protein